MQEYSKTVQNLLKSKNFADIEAWKNKLLQKELKSAIPGIEPGTWRMQSGHLRHYSQLIYKADYLKFQKANSKDYEALARIKICFEGALSISRIDWIRFFGQNNFFPPSL